MRIKIIWLSLLCLLLLLFMTLVSARAATTDDSTTEMIDTTIEDINPFMDYAVDGKESVQLSTLKLLFSSPIISLPGRDKMSLNLMRKQLAASQYHPMYLANGWCLAGIPMYLNKRVYLPDGRIFSFNNSCALNTKVDCGDIFISRDLDQNVTLSNGITIVPFSNNIQKITDPNGNTIQIQIAEASTRSGNKITYWNRLVKITDSLGRIITINHDASPLTITQALSNNTTKTLLSFDSATNTFSDAQNRKTTYSLTDSNYKITYSNGSVSEYILNGSDLTSTVQQHNLYRKGDSSAYQSITYAGTNQSDDFYGNVTVNDGTSQIKYTFTKGYATTEETYNSSGSRLLKRVVKTYSYTSDPRKSGRYFAQPTKISSYLGKSDGTLSTIPSTYSYTYDDYHNVTSVTDPYGNKTYMDYTVSSIESTGNPTLSVALSYMKAYTATFPGAIYKLLAIDTYGGGYEIYYELKKVSTALDKDSSIHAPLYGACGNGWHQMISKATLVKDSIHGTSQLKQTHYKYNFVSGNLIQISEVYNGDYLHTYFTYDSYGNMISSTDANGNKLCYTYSDTYQNGYLTEIQTSGGTNIAKYCYDFYAGNKTMATDAKGNIVYYEYDALNRLTKEYSNNSDAKINYTKQITYDDANNTVTQKHGNATAGWHEKMVTYDSLFGKPTLVQHKNNGNWVTQKKIYYNSNGLAVWSQDGLGHQTTYAYDELGRRTSTKKPNGSVIKFTYDDLTVTVTDANGNQKVQTADLLGRIVSVKESPDSGATYYTTTYTYDTMNHQVKITGPKGESGAIINTFDNLGRIVKTEYPKDSLNPMTAETFTYDNVGNLLTKTNGNGTKTFNYEYFAGYRLKKLTRPDADTVSYTYDANNNPLTATANGAIYSYAYDARNRLTKSKAQLDGYTFNVGYDYDTFNRITGISYPSRAASINYTYNDLNRLTAIPGFISSCAYDDDGKLTAMKLTNGITNTYSYDRNDRPTVIKAGSLMNLSYSYGATDNIIQINDEYYGYDGMDRLTWYGNLPSAQKQTATGTAWSYDGCGNITLKKFYLNGASQGNIAFAYDLADRLCSMGTTTYTNNTAGARTGKTTASESWAFDYDGDSQLTKASKNGVALLQCAYDGAGRRYKKVENGTTTYYIYMGSQPLAEYSPSTGKYTYRIYAGKRAIAEEISGVVQFFHKDHLGSTRVVSDASGNKVADYLFTPYGEKKSAAATDTDYQFTGKEIDASTGLTYFGARYYDPEAGRFISPDPAKHGLNWFEYCNDNPLKFSDNDGRMPHVAVVAGFGFATGVTCLFMHDVMRHEFSSFGDYMWAGGTGAVLGALGSMGNLPAAAAAIRTWQAEAVVQPLLLGMLGGTVNGIREKYLDDSKNGLFDDSGNSGSDNNHDNEKDNEIPCFQVEVRITGYIDENGKFVETGMALIDPDGVVVATNPESEYSDADWYDDYCESGFESEQDFCDYYDVDTYY